MDRKVVIGAGLSGIYLAYELLRKGIDVRIVEHRSRIGGISIIDPDALKYIDKLDKFQRGQHL
jgi:monoamine oxidase